MDQSLGMGGDALQHVFEIGERRDVDQLAALDERIQENAALRHQLDVLCQRLFGKRSERVDARQLQLARATRQRAGRGHRPIEMDSGDTPVRGHTRRRPTGRRPLPGHLPRRRIEIDVPEVDKPCACGQLKTRIGESVAEKLEYEPASFRVIETVRAKYACPHCHDGVVEAPSPPQAIEKARGRGVLAHVIVSKYIDHLPLYRLEQIFAREKIDLSRTTLCEWVAAVATVLTPIGEQLRREITATDYLQTDDTSITVLTDDGGGSYKGRLWTYLDPIGRQRRYRNGPPEICLSTLSRGRRRSARAAAGRREVARR